MYFDNEPDRDPDDEEYVNPYDITDEATLTLQDWYQNGIPSQEIT
jgi:hypothetical protein